MRCLRCGSPQELVVAIHERGLSRDSVHDWSRVMACPSCGYGELRHYSYDSWPSEDELVMEWSTGLRPDALALLGRGLTACPDPTVPACECAVHLSLRESEKGMKRLLILPRREGERPDARVALRDDGVPEFMAPGRKRTPSA